jgi:hypothetical protein
MYQRAYNWRAETVIHKTALGLRTRQAGIEASEGRMQLCAMDCSAWCVGRDRICLG